MTYEALKAWLAGNGGYKDELETKVESKSAGGIATQVPAKIIYTQNGSYITVRVEGSGTRPEDNTYTIVGTPHVVTKEAAAAPITAANTTVNPIWKDAQGNEVAAGSTPIADRTLWLRTFDKDGKQVGKDEPAGPDLVNKYRDQEEVSYNSAQGLGAYTHDQLRTQGRQTAADALAQSKDTRDQGTQARLAGTQETQNQIAAARLGLDYAKFNEDRNKAQQGKDGKWYRMNPDGTVTDVTPPGGAIPSSATGWQPDYNQQDLGLSARHAELQQLVKDGMPADKADKQWEIDYNIAKMFTDRRNSAITSAVTQRGNTITDDSSRRSFADSNVDRAMKLVSTSGLRGPAGTGMGALGVGALQDFIRMGEDSAKRMGAFDQRPQVNPPAAVMPAYAPAPSYAPSSLPTSALAGQAPPPAAPIWDAQGPAMEIMDPDGGDAEWNAAVQQASQWSQQALAAGVGGWGR